MKSFFTTACILILATGKISGQQEYKKIAPKLDGMGGLHYEVNTDQPAAQKYFNQGLVLSYGFNHKEAYRSFKQAAIIDSTLAMAYWGQALVLGPNINAAMSPDNVPKAWNALQKAQALRSFATAKEKDLIDALSHRYAYDPPEDRQPLDSSYATAMGELAQKYPNDLDINTLYAEALMDLHPWDYWKSNGDPQPWTPEIIDQLEYVMARDSLHPGANHLYIHAVEASDNPQRALPSARRLKDLVPGAGHLVHMPSHVYIRTGDYHAGTEANERAVKADNAYVTQCRQQGIYPLAYVPHNYHFLWATATMEGRKERSIKAARNTSDLVDTATMRKPGMGTLQHYWVIPIYAYVRFGEWDEVLQYPKPAEDLIYPLGVWHYARGLAYTAKGKMAKADAELEKLKAIAADPALNEVTIWEINTTKELMEIASHVLQGEMAATRKNYTNAIEHLRSAVAIEDQLNYNEPPDWFFPTRQNLGAILLEANRPKAAEQVYRKDLKKFPDNGWSLRGLYQSLQQQGKTVAAHKVKNQFDEAWRHADIDLEASRIK